MKISDFNTFLQKDWLPFLNINLKWGASLFIRALFITITLVSFILILKVSGIFKDIREIALQDIMGIKPKSTTIISTPDVDYSSDIKDIDNLIEYLEKMKASREKENEIN